MHIHNTDTVTRNIGTDSNCVYVHITLVHTTLHVEREESDD